MKFTLKRLAFPYWKSALVVIALIGGWYFFTGQGTNFGATLTIVPKDFSEQVSVSGTVIAAQDVDLGFAANGRIAGTSVTVGQHVEAGTILAETENDDVLAALAQKQATLAQANANLAVLQAGTRPEEINVAAAAVTNAKSALVDAARNAYTVSDDAVHNKVDAFFINPRTSPKLSFAIGNSILKTSVENDRATMEPILIKWAAAVASLTSETAVDAAQKAQTNLAQVTTLLADASSALNQGLPDQTTTAATLASYSVALGTGRTNVNGAVSTLTSALSVLDSAEKNLTLKQAGSTSENIAAQQAVVASAEADVQNARAALAKTRITAPFTGKVTRMDAKVGAIVSPTTPLISMQSDGTFEIETYISEVSIAGVAVGNHATTTLDAYGTAIPFPAKVVAVDPAETVKDGVPTYKTTLAFLSPDVRIRSGMTANVTIEIGLLRNAIVIPTGAIVTKNGVSMVSVLENEKAVSKTVTTGSSPALGQTQILSGLSSGDVLLLTPAP